jgi:hypothetical protein
MNLPPVTIDGNHYDHVLLTDTAGAHVGNTGTCTVDETASAIALAGGTIFAGSTTSAQTGVAQISGANAAFFNTTPVGVPQPFNIAVTGEAKWGPGPGDKYGSIVVQYRHAGQRNHLRLAADRVQPRLLRLQLPRVSSPTSRRRCRTTPAC